MRSSLARLWIVTVGAVLVSAAPAGALSLTPTVSSSEEAVFSSEFEIIDVVTGLPAGAVILDGAADPTGVSVLFQIEQTLKLGPPTTFGIIVDSIFKNLGDAGLTTAGWIPGAEPDALVDAVSGNIDPFDPAFPLASGDVTFTAGVPETTDVWFFTFSELVPGDVLDISVRLAGFHEFTVVPEPGTALLLVCGLGAAANGARRRERSLREGLRASA